MKFKIGDKVRCINDDNLTWISKGSEYRDVVEIASSDGSIRLSGSKNGKTKLCFYKTHRFELVEEEKKLKWLI